MFPWIALFLGSLLLGSALTVLAELLTPVSPSGHAIRRKLFHVGVFTGAVPAQLFLGFWGVVVYGASVAGIVLIAVIRGDRAGLYRVLSRDGEGRTESLVPLGATALGGLLGLVLVGDFAMVGYLACGWGDAAGEVVGRHWGRTPWSSILPVPLVGSRTLEGSIGVLALGSLGGWGALGVLGFGTLAALGAGLAAGVTGAVAEALSWKGTDNFWAQLLPALVAWWLLG